MKKHLKFLLLPVLASTPAITVVACSSFTGLSDKDILSSALARMADNTFEMTAIKLESLPKNGEKYTELSLEAKNAISDFYTSLVTNGETWDHDNVKVTISGDDKEFEQRYGKNVDSKITLNVNLEYKKLTGSKLITVTIRNDNTTNQQKIEAIGAYLETYFSNDDPSFDIDTLLPNNLNVGDTTNDTYGKLTAVLSKDLISKSKIDYPDVKLSLEPLNNDPQTIIYTLDSNNPEQKEVNASFQNLSLKLILSGDKTTVNIKNNKIKLVQSYANVQNQISDILHQSPSSLQFKRDNLPESNQSLADYDKDKSLEGSVLDFLFEKIENIYPKDKMGADWSKDLLKFTSDAKSTNFIKDSSGERGYFLVEVTFEFNNIKAIVKDLQVNLYS